MVGGGDYIKKRNIWLLALACSAATLALSTVSPEPSSWRFYAGMPGLYVAMVAGWFGLLQSMPSIYILAFLINVLVYYGLIRLASVVERVKAQ